MTVDGGQLVEGAHYDTAAWFDAAKHLRSSDRRVSDELQRCHGCDCFKRSVIERQIAGIGNLKVTSRVILGTSDLDHFRATVNPDDLESLRGQKAGPMAGAATSIRTAIITAIKIGFMEFLLILILILI